MPTASQFSSGPNSVHKMCFRLWMAQLSQLSHSLLF